MRHVNWLEIQCYKRNAAKVNKIKQAAYKAVLFFSKIAQQPFLGQGYIESKAVEIWGE